MRAKLMLAACLAALTVPVASAEDMNWTGFYAGIHGDNLSVATDYETPATPAQSLEGAMLGIQAGYNWQHNNLVFGVEGDLSWGELDDFIRDGNFLTEDGKMNSAGSLRARLGLSVDNWLPYLTGGWAWNELEQGSTCPVGAPFGVCAFTGAFDVRSTESFSGWVFGAGVEVAVAPHWSLKTEYLAGDYGSASYTGTVPGFGTVTTSVQQDIDYRAQVGVNYRF